mmetsp:Transcript_5267/g.10400  ORF Transcript_5267/g.10400 Transcript_5267/m.10400 type:complete len:253 (-) Transcript_5267:462-1220(-)
MRRNRHPFVRNARKNSLTSLAAQMRDRGHVFDFLLHLTNGTVDLFVQFREFFFVCFNGIHLLPKANDSNCTSNNSTLVSWSSPCLFILSYCMFELDQHCVSVRLEFGELVCRNRHAGFRNRLSGKTTSHKIFQSSIVSIRFGYITNKDGVVARLCLFQKLVSHFDEPREFLHQHDVHKVAKEHVSSQRRGQQSWRLFWYIRHSHLHDTVANVSVLVYSFGSCIDTHQPYSIENSYTRQFESHLRNSGETKSI